MPDSVTRRMQTVNSNYDTDTGACRPRWRKPWPPRSERRFQRQHQQTQRPFSQSPIPSVYSEIMQPEADSRSYTSAALSGDKINFDLDSHNFAVIPGVRVVHQSTKPENLSDLAANSSVLSESSVANLYGKNSDTRGSAVVDLPVRPHPAPDDLPAVPARGAVPNASQLYGSWNLGSSYAGSQQYALIGNTDLKTETSDNLEWGLKGKLPKASPCARRCSTTAIRTLSPIPAIPAPTIRASSRMCRRTSTPFIRRKTAIKPISTAVRLAPNLTLAPGLSRWTA